MEQEGPSPCSQKPKTRPNPEPDKSSQSPHTIFLRLILILSSHVCLDLQHGPHSLDNSC